MANVQRPYILARDADETRKQVWTHAPYDYTDERMAAAGITTSNLNQLGQDGGILNLVQANEKLNQLDGYVNTDLQQWQTDTRSQLDTLTNNTLPPVTSEGAYNFLRVSGDGTGWYWGKLESQRYRPFNAELKEQVELSAVDPPAHVIHDRKIIPEIQFTISEDSIPASSVLRVQVLHGDGSRKFDLDLQPGSVSVQNTTLSLHSVDLRPVDKALLGPSLTFKFTMDGRDYLDDSQPTYEKEVDMGHLLTANPAPDSSFAPGTLGNSRPNQFLPGTLTWKGDRRPAAGQYNENLCIQFEQPIAVSQITGKPAAVMSLWLTDISPSIPLPSDPSVSIPGILLWSSELDSLAEDRTQATFNIDLRNFINEGHTFKVTAYNLPNSDASSVSSAPVTTVDEFSFI